MNDNKDKLNDFSSLFLPDLLRSFSAPNQDIMIKQEDDSLMSSMLQDPRTALSNDLPSLSLFQQDSDPSAFAPYDQMSISQANPDTSGLNPMEDIIDQTSQRRNLPFAAAHDDSARYTLHYSDFIPAEAAGFQLQTFRQLKPNPHMNQHQHVLPIQQAFSPLTVIGQFDGISYYGGMGSQYPVNNMNQYMASQNVFLDMDPQTGFRPAMTPDPTELLKQDRQYTKDLATQFQTNNPQSLHHASHQLPHHSQHHHQQHHQGQQSQHVLYPPHSQLPYADNLNGRVSPGTSRVDDGGAGSAFSDIPLQAKHPRAERTSTEFDYSVEKLLRLVDLKPTSDGPLSSVFDEARGAPNIELASFLSGRFYTNDQDNNNYLSVTKELSSDGQKCDPQVISCYRRNFIRFNVKVQIKSESNTFFDQHGSPIRKFRLDVLAFVDGKCRTQIPVLINKEKDPIRDLSKNMKDSFVPFFMDTSQDIDAEDIKNENFFCIRKAQFKTATANSGNLSFQTFFRFHLRLTAITDNGETILQELVSSPIVVRGRNPSFYQKRRDILIPSRTPTARSSFNVSEALHYMKVPHAEHTSYEENVSASAPEDETMSSGQIQEREGSNDGSRSKSKEPEEYPNRLTPTAGKNLNSALNLKELLDPKSFVDANGEPSRYRYFPILNVYYLPPINVVYFPHGAHQLKRDTTETADEVNVATEKTTDSPANKKADRKRNVSKVYFK